MRALVVEAADRAGVSDVMVEIDEELPLPLTGFTADLVDGQARIWISGGSLEDGRFSTHLHVANAAVELTAAMLRVADRSRSGFVDAPADEDLTDRDRSTWETWAYGRCVRLGLEPRVQRCRYGLRLHHGFTDVTDAAFGRLWAAGDDELTWADLVAIGEETAAVDPRPTSTSKQRVRPSSLRHA